MLLNITKKDLNTNVIAKVQSTMNNTLLTKTHNSKYCHTF